MNEGTASVAQQPQPVKMSGGLFLTGTVIAVRTEDKEWEKVKYTQTTISIALRHPQRQGRNRDAAAIEHAHGVGKSLPFATQEILRPNHAVFKNQLGRIAGPQSQLVFFLAGTKSPGVFL